MEGTIPARQLTAVRKADVGFSVARQSDDFEIRRLLRENPTAGRISLSFEREPNYFAEAPGPSETKQTIVARSGGRVVCVGSCSKRQRFVNGEPCHVGYLGSLRLDSRHAGRFDILRRGYDCFHQLQQEDPADFYFTSIAADNARARKFLERSVPGMPQYEFLGEFATLMIPTRVAHRPADHFYESQPDFSEVLLSFLNESNRQYQLAPSWSAPDRQLAGRSGVENPAIRVLRDGQKIKACGAVWDQRAFKQVVVRDYSKSLKLARPLLNGVAQLAGTPRLPSIGTVLSNAFASHLAATTPENLVELMDELVRMASDRGLEFLTAGFDSNDPRLASMRKGFRPREYRSRLYLVHWPDIGASARQLDDRLLSPEVALL